MIVLMRSGEQIVATKFVFSDNSVQIHSGSYIKEEYACDVSCITDAPATTVKVSAYRSAETGEFVTEEYARQKPSTTVKETN